MKQKIVFEKMHGIGNDFVLIDLRKYKLSLTSQDIQVMANRHKGIGFDQLLLIDNSDDGDCDAAYRFFNPDGSQAEQCGNGQRCISNYLHKQNPEQKTFCVSGLAGKIESKIIGKDIVQVNMGKVNSINSIQINNIACVEVNFGNPHLVCMLDDITNKNLVSLNEEFTRNYTQGINFEIVEIVESNEIKIRVHERGTGETLACGSGACASVFALIQNKQLNDKVKVLLPGGTLVVEYDRTTKNLFLTGPAQHVFTGEIFL